MFDDPAQEINDLTAVIKQDITALNAAISDLQQTAKNRHDNKESGSHSLTVVDALKGRLVRATLANRTQKRRPCSLDVQYRSDAF